VICRRIERFRRAACRKGFGCMCAVVDAGTSAQTGGHAGTEISPGRGDKWRFKLEPAGFALRGLFAGAKRRLLTK